MNVEDIFSQVNDFLPEGETAKSVSVYFLPYPGFIEVYVECNSGKRYRALANKVRTISEFVEVKIPGVQNA